MPAFSCPNLLLTLSHLTAPTAVGKKHMKIKDPADHLSTIPSGETLVPAHAPLCSTTFVPHVQHKPRPYAHTQVCNYILMVWAQADFQAQDRGAERFDGDGQAVHLTLLWTAAQGQACAHVGLATSVSPTCSSREVMHPTLVCGAPRWQPNYLHPEDERLKAFRLGCHFIVWTWWSKPPLSRRWLH